ncbi:hypothetical protein Y032_0225g2742 [Ancylostoma ceylanicum]|uniref:Uncharacterized protein n=1 Tax=Ancylostoma ceylanicum TaxID=53326 RepID=A0A016SI04_9BILA|nr:hypothetical protein Y032_0225g2742 [Ancylostoma ceylanicum]
MKVWVTATSLILLVAVSEGYQTLKSIFSQIEEHIGPRDRKSQNYDDHVFQVMQGKDGYNQEIKLNPGGDYPLTKYG